MGTLESLKELEDMINVGGTLAEADEILETLKKRETPMNPVQVVRPFGTVVECPVCHHPVQIFGNYCIECGQRLYDR